MLVCDFVRRPRDAMQVRQSGERVDVMHYHVNEGRWEGKWEDCHSMYQQILQVSSVGKVSDAPALAASPRVLRRCL